MIYCKNISKAYGTLSVLHDFSYDFSDSGFYLLYGESGCGKTTLLNVLCGLLPFEAGEIVINGTPFVGQIDTASLGAYTEYITQDPFFVDYLNVWDNLYLVKQDAQAITQVLARFGLAGKEKQLPLSLSGGERQRLVLARALLSKKKILLLDEPTAALDEQNKQSVFALLAELSRDCLVVCASHDQVAWQYTDHVLEFEKEHRYLDAPAAPAEKKPYAKQAKGKPTGHRSKKGEPVAEKSGRVLRRLLRKWFGSKRKNRRAEVLFAVFLLLAFTLCFLADTPTNKTNASVEFAYKINMLHVETTGDGTAALEYIRAGKGVSDVAFNCKASQPDVYHPIQHGGGIIEGMEAYTKSVYPFVLPDKAEDFGLVDCLILGEYFTGPDQIIITKQMAEQLSPRHLERVIGKKLKYDLFPIGETELEVVGVLGDLDAMQAEYLNATNAGNFKYETKQERQALRNVYFISSSLARELSQDPLYHATGDKRTYKVYFDSYGDMMQFYEQSAEELQSLGARIEPGWRNYELESLFSNMSMLLLPTSLLILLFSVLFFINIQKTEISYNSKFISVFNYAGYPLGRVISCFVNVSIARLLVIGLCCMGGAFLLTLAGNAINAHYMIFKFQLFSYNPVLLALYLLLLCLSCFALSHLLLRPLRYRTWYENIVSARDLI